MLFSFFFFFSSRRRHTRWTGDWSSDVCSSDLWRRRHAVRAGRGEGRVRSLPRSPRGEHRSAAAAARAGLGLTGANRHVYGGPGLPARRRRFHGYRRPAPGDDCGSTGVAPETTIRGQIMAEFADHALLRVQAGHGGHGCASVHREKFKPLGGPDGGNGGRGGSVILEVDASTSTLLDFHRRPVRKAANGHQGEGSNRNGAAGDDQVVKVPSGTVVLGKDGEVLADLVGTGTRFIAAAGGRGGLGNAALASQRRRAPGFALKGEPGEGRELTLELKSVADIGLIGFPNAGKSSLIAAMSAARATVANC